MTEKFSVKCNGGIIVTSKFSDFSSTRWGWFVSEGHMNNLFLQQDFREMSKKHQKSLKVSFLWLCKLFPCGKLRLYFPIGLGSMHELSSTFLHIIFTFEYLRSNEEKFQFKNFEGREEKVFRSKWNCFDFWQKSLASFSFFKFIEIFLKITEQSTMKYPIQNIHTVSA